MARLVVTCAACGNKHPGEPGQQMKCVACSNILTVPEDACSAYPGRYLCSNCWTETVLKEKVQRCEVCEQRISRVYGGSASFERSSRLVAQSAPERKSEGRTGSSSSGRLGAVITAPAARHSNAQPSTPLVDLVRELSVPAQPASAAAPGQAGSADLRSAMESRIVDLERQVHESVQWSDAKASCEAKLNVLEAALAEERKTVERLQRERQELATIEAELTSKFVAMANRLAEQSAPPIGAQAKCAELEMRVCELEAHLGAEKAARQEAAQERNQLAGRQVELEAHVAALERIVANGRATWEAAQQERRQLAELRAQVDTASEELGRRLVEGDATANPADSGPSAIAEKALQQMVEMTREYQSSLKRLADEAEEVFSQTHLIRKRIEAETQNLGQHVADVAERFREHLETESAALGERLVQMRLPLTRTAFLRDLHQSQGAAKEPPPV
jgi:hypothetical protein